MHRTYDKLFVEKNVQVLEFSKYL